MTATNDTNRGLDDQMGEIDAPEPAEPADVVEVPTDWEPTADDELEAGDA